MSTAPLFPPEPPHEPNPNRRPLKLWQPSPRLRRVFAWIFAINLLLTVLVPVTIAVLLHSQRFHQYIIARVQSSVADSLGTRLDLQNFALNFSPLSLDLYGVTLHGATPYPNVPLLQLQHAHVGVRIVSFLQQKWYLSDVQLDHPVVQVFVDKNGVSNIPKPKPSDSKSNTTIWDLGIRHVVLDNGEVYYNAQATPLQADLRDLNFLASYSELRTMYSGSLQYSNGRVAFGAYQPFEHNFAAQFDLTPTTFQLHRAQLTSSAAQINLAATATNFSAPKVDAKYDVIVDGAQLAKLINNPSVPQGQVHATGSAAYQMIENVPALQTLTINGDLASKQILVNTPSLRAAIDNIAAHYSLSNGDAVLHDLRAGILGGELTAQGTMKQIGGAQPHSDFTASLRNVSLAQASSLAGSKSKQPVAINGVLNADAKATWGKTLDDLVAKVDSTIHAQATGKHPAAITTVSTTSTAPGQVPINGEIHATYTGVSKSIALANSSLRTPQTTVSMNGTLSNHSALAIQLQANDLREFASIADMFSTPKPGQHPQPLDLAGSATFNGNVTGSTSAPHLTGQLAANNLRVNGSTWRVFRTGVDASPSEARLINADLEPLPKGRINLNASVGLNQWAFTNTSPLQIQLDASQLDIASLAKLAGQQQLPVSGTLNTHLTLHGSEETPIGNGTLSITNASAYSEPINSVQVNFGGTGDQAQATLSIKLPAGSIESNVTVRPKEKTYTAQLTSTGIDIQKLETVKAKNLDATGTVQIHASGQGSFDNPQLTASIQIPSLTIQKQQVANIKLDANVANHVANATLSSAALNTNIQAKARVNLTGDYDTDATLDTQNIPLQPLVALYSPANAATLSGATELHATLHGPAKNKNLLEAHITIPYLKVNYNNTIQLAAAAPIHADYKNSVLTVQHSAIKGTDTNLEFEGSIPVGSNAPMSLLLKGNVDLALAQIFDPDIRTAGQIRFNIDSHGTSAQDIGGEIDIVNASYSSRRSARRPAKRQRRAEAHHGSHQHSKLPGHCRRRPGHRIRRRRLSPRHSVRSRHGREKYPPSLSAGHARRYRRQHPSCRHHGQRSSRRQRRSHQYLLHACLRAHRFHRPVLQRRERRRPPSVESRRTSASISLVHSTNNVSAREPHAQRQWLSQSPGTRHRRRPRHPWPRQSHRRRHDPQQQPLHPQWRNHPVHQPVANPSRRQRRRSPPPSSSTTSTCDSRAPPIACRRSTPPTPRFLKPTLLICLHSEQRLRPRHRPPQPPIRWRSRSSPARCRARSPAALPRWPASRSSPSAPCSATPTASSPAPTSPSSSASREASS